MSTILNTVPFFMHDMGDVELEAIARVFKGPILTTGDTVLEFEKKFASMFGVHHALGVTSCTGALHMSLMALGVGAGDEVITTPMTFIASSTAILEAGATPVFVDVEPNTGNLDANKIKAAITKKTKAILPVHLYGQMCDMRVLRSIADEHGLFIIEDAAHCVEGRRDGIAPGQLGDTACFSFYATKNLTCGEGGAVITNQSHLFEKLKLLRTHGMTKTANDRSKEGYTHWDMKVLGWKYNMDNIQAAMLLPQIERLDSTWLKREELARYYDLKLNSVPNISRLDKLDGVKHAWHLYPILVGNGKRDELIKNLQARGVSLMVNYRSIHLLTFFEKTLGYQSGAFPVSESFGNEILSLPFFPSMTFEQVDYVAKQLLDLCS